MKRLSALALTLFLLLPQVALASSATGAEEEFDPSLEWELHEWIPIHLGPLNLSITKAVAYLMLGSLLTIAFGLFFMRSKLGRLFSIRTVGSLLRVFRFGCA